MLYSDRSALIVGTRAVGAVFGAALLAAGWHVTFRVHPERFLTYRRVGLTIRHGERETRIDGERFICDAVARGSHQLVFVCVKMPEFKRAIRALADDDDGERVYVTTQNGLAAPQMCAALFGKERVLAGAAVVNAQRTKPGLVEVFSDVRELVLAPLPPAGGIVARAIAARLAQAGINTQIAPSADVLLWERFVETEPLATACAVTQLSLGDVRSQPVALRFLRGLFDEVFDVAHAAGAEFSADAQLQCWQAYLSAPPSLRPSLAIDVAAGRAGELDWLTGAVVRMAGQLRVRAPLHRDALQTLRSKCTQGLRPVASAGRSAAPGGSTHADGARDRSL
ncbi:MAG: ketopantoate reductase family protein [Burkholderiaceae bacterium]